MKAIIYEKYGPPEVVRLTEVAKPVPKNNELLIKVHAATVNRTDCGFRSAEYFIVRFFSGLIHPKNKILGCEYAGIVEETGKDITAFKAGDKVFGYNDTKFGAHAEYISVNENDAVAKMPENLSFHQAAPLTEGCHYALCNLRASKIQRGQKYLINGATGAIGSAAVQLAKYFGAEVTAVCDAKNVELVKSLGPDMVIDYTKQDFTKIDRQFDVVFDAVGKSSFGKCKPILEPKGIYISTELGYASQNPFLALVTPFLGGKKVLFPIPAINREDVNFIRTLANEGSFTPVIDRHYKPEQIVEAYRYVESGTKTGNVIIDMVD